MADFRQFSRTDQAVIRAALLHLALHCRRIWEGENDAHDIYKKQRAAEERAIALAQLIPAEPGEL